MTSFYWSKYKYLWNRGVGARNDFIVILRFVMVYICDIVIVMFLLLCDHGAI